MSKRIPTTGIITATIFVLVLFIMAIRPTDFGTSFSCKNGEFKGFEQSKEPLVIGSAIQDCNARAQVYVNNKIICDNTASTGKPIVHIHCKNLKEHLGEHADIYYTLESQYGDIQEVKENILINT